MVEPAAAPGKPLQGKHVVVLPDLYLDVLAPLGPWTQARRDLDAIAGRGGGNLPVGPIEFCVGGNAANLALALARLGADVDLIAETDPLGLHVLQHEAAGTPLRLDRVRTGDTASATIGLECEDANIMLSHAGPLARFSPGHLTQTDWQAIAAADAVAVTNWAQNPHGTLLVEALAARLAGTGSFLYLDAGDPRHRMTDAAHLLARATGWEGLSAWGMNDNEALAFASAAGLAVQQDAVHAAALLARHLTIRIDLHTRTLAATLTPDGLQHIEPLPTDAPTAHRLTGAGDAWNAGNLAGHLLGWPDAQRLASAHETATRHVAGPGRRARTPQKTPDPTLLTGMP